MSTETAYLDQSDRTMILMQSTTEIVAAYVSKSPASAADLPKIIIDVHTALAGLGNVEPVAEKPEPAVPIRKSITADAIICLECGTKHTSIKRHLGTAHALTPEAYRDKWGLPPDYPMVTAAYSQRRSDLAKQHGLGKH